MTDTKTSVPTHVLKALRSRLPGGSRWYRFRGGGTWIAPLMVLASVVVGVLPVWGAPQAAESPPNAPTRERFFGAVQAIYSPDRAKQAGVEWERLIFPWSLIQKNGPNDWAPGYFTDDQVAQEAARGMDLVGVALYTPQWASSTPRQPKTTNVPANLYLPFDDPRNYWGQFMYRLASRYRGQITTWIVWNEPDMYSDAIRYNWDGSIEDFYQLLKVAYLAVKKADPSARVALPGMTYWWDQQNGRPLYLARLLEVAGRDPTARDHGGYFDVVTLHQYGNPLNIYLATRATQRALAQFALKKPIWVGEANIPPYDDPTAPITRVLHATMDQQASFMVQAFALARAAGVERMSVYKLVDERPEGPGELFGLVRNDGSTRPAFAAYQTAVRYLSGITSAVYTWDGAGDKPTVAQDAALLDSNRQRTQWIWPAGVNRVTVERGAERVTIAWNGSSRPVTAHLPAVATSAEVVDQLGRDTGEALARDGSYSIELPPASNNTDPKDPSAYLVAGAPKLLVEKVSPIPAQVEAPIQVIWPRNGSGPADATRANITAVLLQPDGVASAQSLLPGQPTPSPPPLPTATPTPSPTPAPEAAPTSAPGQPSPADGPRPTATPAVYRPVPCRWTPAVTLRASVDGGPGNAVAQGVPRMVHEDGLTYPVWDFYDVDVSPATRGQTLTFWVDVDGDGASADSSYWVYTADDALPRQPTWQQRPTMSCA